MKKIEWKFLLSQILEVIEMERGLLFNLKELTFRPNKFITNYLSGLTKGVMNPFSYLLVILTIITLVSGIIVNSEDGLTGLKLLEVYVNWKFILSFVFILFILVVLQSLVFGSRLLDAIISSTFFTAHYSFLLSILILIASIFGFRIIPETGKIGFLSQLTLFSDAFPALLIAFSALSAYVFLFFKPTVSMPNLNFISITKSIFRTLGIVITIFVWYCFFDVGIYVLKQGMNINSAPASDKWNQIYMKSYQMDERTQKQISLNNLLLQSESANQDLHLRIKSVSIKLDSLKEYVRKESSSYLWLADSNRIGSSKIPQSIIDPSKNPHLLQLNQDLDKLNQLLELNDGIVLNFEIDLSGFKAKSIGEVLHYVQGKMQELNVIQSMIIYETLSNNQDSTANK